MDKEKELFQAVYKSEKNTISQTLQSTTETIKENRDIKEGKPIEEITSYKTELIKTLIESYTKDVETQNISTYKASLAR